MTIAVDPTRDDRTPGTRTDPAPLVAAPAGTAGASGHVPDRPPAGPPPVDPLAIGAAIAALPVPPVGLALGVAALRRQRSGAWRGTGLAVAGVVVGGLLTIFWALVATLLVIGVLAAATSPAPTTPVPAASAAPTAAPAPSGPDSAAADPGVVSAAQLEQQLAGGIGLRPGAVSCPSALPARVGASEACRVALPSRGPVTVIVSVTSVQGDDVDLHYDIAPTGT